ncbi:FAD-binding protein [Actinopolymorpha sp. B9G3]|uniref:FAD-binding protein n=1 Tax=Actinopolymorpha sp. B9G3 TaxID=3158970 RepID=UPI0032D90667
MNEGRSLPLTELPPLDGELSLDTDVRAAAADDFGHVVERMPLAVLRPGSVQDIALVTRWAADNGWKIAARGQGHSTFGRSQVDTGIVIDMTGFGDIHRVGEDHIVVGAGATWRSVLAATLPRKLTPPVLTNYLDLSVGGTLSVGGIGGTTHRYGMATDNVRELEVVTGEGKVLTCSREENPELFDCVRAGLGQFALITRATLSLVAAPDRARRYALVYPDLESLAADQRLLLRKGRADHLQGSILAPDGRWRHQLEMVVFHASGDQPDDDAVLAGLADDRAQAQIDDLSYREYVEAFDKFEELLRTTGEWANPHPWWLTFLPGSAAEETAAGVLADIEPQDLGVHGLVTFYPLTIDAIRTPLVTMPAGDVAFTFNLIRFASTDTQQVTHMLEQNRALYPRIRAAGGVVYPVSAFPLTPSEWEEHLGARWPVVRNAKERFDPAHCLTPGYEVF